MEFLKYMSLKRLGDSAVNGILDGVCYVFPKIDGTNASVWMDEEGVTQAGSRNRHLDESSNGDNAGFCKWAKSSREIRRFLECNPHLRLYGEWLVPHTIKGYREDAWKKFYIFDVYDNETESFLPYDDYIGCLKSHGLDFVEPLCLVNNPTYDELVEISRKNEYLMEEGIGEGIVIKNYDFVNRFGLKIWAKLVTGEFQMKHTGKVKEIKEVEHEVEDAIVEKFFTPEFVRKEYYKLLWHLKNKGEEWTAKHIPLLLEKVYYEFMNEESYNYVKKYKYPIINHKVLKAKCTNKTKEVLKVEVFKK